MLEKDFIIITFLGIILLMVGVTAFICAMIVTYKRKQSEHDREQLRARIEVQEETVEQISQELHDNVGHELTLAKLQIKNVANAVGGDEGVQLSCVVDLLTKTLDTVRDISKSLSPGVIKAEGLQVAITRHVERLRNATKYEIRFDVYGTYDYMSENIETVLFRIFQEALSNIVRHAKAKAIAITLECSPTNTVLTVCDDGIGFDVPHYNNGANDPKYIGGLRNMKIRAALIKGDVRISSKVGKGTKIEVSVPFNSKISRNE